MGSDTGRAAPWWRRQALGRARGGSGPALQSRLLVSAAAAGALLVSGCQAAAAAAARRQRPRDPGTDGGVGLGCA